MKHNKKEKKRDDEISVNIFLITKGNHWQV